MKHPIKVNAKEFLMKRTRIAVREYLETFRPDRTEAEIFASELFQEIVDVIHIYNSIKDVPDNEIL